MTIHLLQLTDWKKHSAATWVEQFGVWVRSHRVSSPGAYECPLAAMIDKNNLSGRRSSRRVEPALLISDDEARAVQRLLLDMLHSVNSHISRQAWVLILKYEHRWTDLAISHSENCTEAKVPRLEKDALKEFKKRSGCL